MRTKQTVTQRLINIWRWAKLQLLDFVYLLVIIYFFFLGDIAEYSLMGIGVNRGL